MGLIKDEAGNQIWRPTLKQEKFLQVPISIKEGFFGGGAGGGKSELLLMYAIANGWYKNPRFKQVFMRRTFPELRNEILPRSREFYTPLGAKFNKTDMAWTFPSGAIIFLASCEYDDDVHNFDSMEINLFTPDELTSFSEWIYTYIALQRVRTSDPTLPAITRAAGMPGGPGHCIPYGEVLTPNGWKDIEYIQVGDPIYEVDPQGYLIDSVVEQKHEHNFNGNLWEANTSNLHINCTPEHRVKRLLGKCGRDFETTLTPVKDLPGQANISRTCNFIGRTFPEVEIGKYKLNTHQFLQLLGWFLSEGYTLSQPELHSYRLGICQSKELNRIKIELLLQSIGIPYYKSDTAFEFYDRDLWKYFNQFGKSSDKFIPREVLSWGSLDLLLDTLMAGDGHWQSETHGCYYTISSKLANDFCELAVKCGWQVNMKVRLRENRTWPSYDISITRNEFTEILTGQHVNNVKTKVKRDSNVKHIPYNGKVYDIGVPKYHTFVVRQNGSVWISGNSWVYKRFIKPLPDGNKILIGKGGVTRIFVPATLVDNKHIDKSYSQQLDALNDAERKAKKFGDWTAYEGSVFDEFRDKRFPGEPENALHVIKPFEIPKHWPRIVAIDWGFSAMTSIGFGAISPKKRLIVYKHLHFIRTKIEDWAPILNKHLIEDQPEDIVICHSANQDRGTPHTILQQVEQAINRSIRLGERDRIAGKMLLHEYLRWEEIPQVVDEYDHNLAVWIRHNKSEQEYLRYLSLFQPKDKEEIPKLLLFDDPDVALIGNAIKACSYEKSDKSGKNREDVAEFNGDDPYDMLRMLLHAADRYFDQAIESQEKFERHDSIVRKFVEDQDMTAYYRNMRALEKEKAKEFQPIMLSRIKRNYSRSH